MSNGPLFQHDDQFDSTIDTGDPRDGCAKFLLEAKTSVEFFQGTDHRGSKCVPFSDTTEQDDFKTKFSALVYKGWGNGAIWLKHGQGGDKKNLWCEIKITYVTDPKVAQLQIHAVKLAPGESSGSYKSKCEHGGFGTYAGGLINPIDMYLSYDDVTTKDTHNGTDKKGNPTGDLKQWTPQHEFGHYLGCYHFCDWATVWGNSPPAYCEGQSKEEMEHIMAKGNKWVRGDAISSEGAKVTIPFVHRLEKHGYVSVEAVGWVAKGHTDEGGGQRTVSPWK